MENKTHLEKLKENYHQWGHSYINETCKAIRKDIDEKAWMDEDLTAVGLILDMLK